MTAPPTSSAAAASWLPELPDLNGIGRTDLRARWAYSEGAGIFRIIPAGVAVPSTTAALRDLVTWAAHRRVPLVPRGAGSGMAGGNVGPGLIVDLTTLDGCPIEVLPDIRRAYTGAGATLRDLNAATERYGLRLPPDPSSARFATLGGMVSTNAAGRRSVRSGSTRRWVEAVDLITADGEPLTLRRGVAPSGCAAVERFTRDAEPALRAARDTITARFPRTRKNSSGYALDAWLASGDLIDLIIGAEGTLAFVTSIEWRLVPAPTRYAGVRAAVASVDAVGRVVPPLLALDPSALELLDATFLDFVGAERKGEGLLLVEFEGDDGDTVERRLEEARGILAGEALEVEDAHDPRGLEELWSIRHAASPLLARMGDNRRSLQVIEDACVPVERLPAYISAVREAGKRRRTDLVIFGHAGDGNLHVNLQPDLAELDWEERVERIFAEVSAAVIGLGGTLSGEHGDGRLRAALLRDVYGPEIVALFRLVKDAFDPEGILNPGVKLPAEDTRGFAALKVGAGAVPIGPDVEAGLRDIERFARYSLARLDLADAPPPASAPPA